MEKITWIKNDKIKTMSGLSYRFFGHDEAYSITIENARDLECEIPEDIDLLHFKNYNFSDIFKTTFKCLNKNTIIMLEECTFGHRTQFKNGNIVVERPKRRKNGIYDHGIKFQETESIDLVFSDNTVKDERYDCAYERFDCTLDNVDTLSVTGEADDIIISKYSDGAPLKKIKLDDVYNLSINWLEANEVEIKNSEVTLDTPLEMKKLKIETSTITMPYSHKELMGDIEIKDSKILSPKMKINGNVYIPENRELIFSEDNKSSGALAVARTELISSLKAVSNKASTACEKEQEKKRQELERKYEPQKREQEKALAEAQNYQEYYANLIVERQAAISKIDQKLDSKMENIASGLVKQKIRTVVPTTNKK